MSTDPTNTKPTFVTRCDVNADTEYVHWLRDIKRRFRQAQTRAIVRVNAEMLQFYWSIGRDMHSMHIEDRWGDGIVKQLALDLRNEFPGEKGFSDTNIKYIRRWYSFYYQYFTISHQAGDQLEIPTEFSLVPWKHHVHIFTKSTSVEEALYYIHRTIDCNSGYNCIVTQLSDIYQCL